MSSDVRLVAIVGPTASGKTALALQLAQRYNGEIICADSRTIYRGMDIGTAKPTLADRMTVPHHLLNVINPDEPYSAAEFKHRAMEIIADITSRHQLPMLVGGTGLYVNAVLYDYQFPAGPSKSLRSELEQLPLAELVKRLKMQDPERSERIDLKNPRRVVRALETVGRPRIAPSALPSSTLIIGLNPGMAELERRIRRRTRDMLDNGLAQEVAGLIHRYNPILEPLNTVGYREVADVLTGKIAESQLESLITLHTRQLAKRQLTWFKRNPDIHWAVDGEEAAAIAKRYLAKPV